MRQNGVGVVVVDRQAEVIQIARGGAGGGAAFKAERAIDRHEID